MGSGSSTHGQRAWEPQPEPRLRNVPARSSGENEELHRLQEELRQAKNDAQKALRKLAKQEERPELVLARQAGHHQTNERTPWEHADWARSQIKRIYEEHRPEKLPSVDSLMKAWLGAEEELLAQIQAKYQPDSESVVVRKLKRHVARLRDERNRVRTDLEQRLIELAEEKADLERGWNSALKTLELERNEHSSSLEELRAQVEQLPADASTTSKEAGRKTEITELEEELQQAWTQAALARRKQVDAEVKGIALRKLAQRSDNTKRLASPSQDRLRATRRSREPATRAQYQLFQTFAGDSVITGGGDRGRVDQGWRTERHQLDGRPRTWIVASANGQGADNRRQGHTRAVPEAAVAKAKNSARQRPERPERLAVRVPQRTLSGTYGGITWAQSWHDATATVNGNQPAGDMRFMTTEGDPSGTACAAGTDNTGAADSKAHRPSSADVMLRWAMQEQVESLAPTASATPFN